MTFSELLKSVAFWTGMKNEDIEDDPRVKAVITSRMNRRLERYLGLIGSGSRLSQLDDTNYTNQPFSLFDITEGQNDYEFLVDEDGNTITDFTAVLLKVGTSFRELDKMTLDEKNATLVMSPNTDKLGTPTKWLERNNTVFFDFIPNYSLVEGAKLFYKRGPSYFSVSDTTKEPGIPVYFHEMLAVATSYDWLLVNKPNARVQISEVKEELSKWEKDFKVSNQLRNPQKSGISPRTENTR